MEVDNRVRCQYYSQCLFSESGAIARDYLASRGVGDDTARAFSLGWCPNDWLGHDIWKRRLIYPLIDAYGEVIGFSGRLLTYKVTDPDGTQKVLERETDKMIKLKRLDGTKETGGMMQFHDPFPKTYFLYGLHTTKAYIREANYVIVVEGQLDLLSLYNAGIRNVVATLGSALTDFHIGVLSRYCDFMIFLFDADEAGLKALKLARQRSTFGYDFLKLPNQYDPNDFVLKHGALPIKESVEKLIHKNSRNFLDITQEKLYKYVNTL